MAALKLRFRIVNSGIGIREIEIDHEGEPAVVKQRKLYVDAEPLDGSEKTLELVLPADQAEAFPIGAIITATLTVESLADAGETPAGEEA